MAGFIPDPFERTVRVPVKFIQGAPQPFYGGPWPKIEEGTIGDLIVPAWAFEKPQDAVLLSAPLTAPILPRGDELLVGLSPSAHTHEVLRPGPQLRILPNFSGFAKVRLDGELRLTLRGTKKASLEPCRCWIPALKSVVGSLNEAYTRLSLYYEPHRRSHTGNAFRHFFFRSKTQSGEPNWQPLELKRERMEWRLAERFHKRESPG